MKKIVLFILLLFPVLTYASCDYNKHDEYLKIAHNITYDNSYSKSSSSFIVTVYNVFSGMYVEYNNKKHYPNSENEVTISGIKEGTVVMLKIFADDGCDPIKRITIKESYYNNYFKSSICNGYEGKITMCSYQFTSTKTTESLVKGAIDNYNNPISKKIENEEESENGFLSKIKDFFLNWGIKIILLVVTTGLVWAFYSDKFRKIKHGI